ncbi:hypothetical protein E1B28_012787 [Marasmius oreades]|uniref:RING-type domain-containing protein n=1 Tax=Marasmius oreades TaxID=181124 RepID=A0A9P7UNM5_9AGAR|nr:uncharacterized protein E1B28_012787 [Marasmius oreades]KAG7088832.1 hypothetical protein E1B28_012787 [Marasmius oreades]
MVEYHRTCDVTATRLPPVVRGGKSSRVSCAFDLSTTTTIVASMPQKVADAANIAPYLTHVVTHHGQLSLIPPDNAGRMRQQKQKPRSINPDDDIRFNTGPKFYKVLPASSRGSEGRSQSRPNRRDRGRPTVRDVRENDSVDDEDIPNYPPPSFDEAISSPPISVCPSTVTFTTSSTRYHPPSASASSAPTSEPASSAITDDSSDPDSDSDVYVVASSRSSPCEPFTDDFSGEDCRSPTPSPVLVDEEDDDRDSRTAVTPVGNKQQGRRKLSLSPLRTLFPLKSSNTPQRALSAHPYSQSRNPSPFFRSTTSLTTFGSATPTSAGNKGKEKDIKGEDFDSEWEFVGRPTSLILNPELAMSAPSPTPAPITRSPPKTQISRTPFPGVTPAPAPASTPTLVDKKTPFLKPKPKKPRRRDTAPSPLSSSPSTSTIAAEAGPVVTTVRTRRTQLSPVPQKGPKPASPLRSETWNDVSETEVAQQAILQRATNTPLPNTPTEKAVAETFHDQDIPPTPPPPATSVNHACTDGADIVPHGISVPGETPFSRQVSRPFSDCRSGNPSFEVQSKHPGEHIHEFTSAARPVVYHIDTRKPSLSYRPPSSPISTTPSSASTHTITPTHTPTQTQFSHHYPGRPLPRPPPSSNRAIVDSTYAGSITEGTCSSRNKCPEGLLIDFGEPVHEHGSPVDSEPTPALLLQRTHDSNGGSPSSKAPATISRPLNSNDTVRYRFGSSDEFANRNRTESSARAASVTEPNPNGGYSHFTDLDRLVSRLDETELRNGSSYETLLTLSEFMGPASPPSLTRNLNTQTAKIAPVPLSESSAPLLGRISVDRRRVTKDGRVRVKLILLECGVDKCGICFIQFKEGDHAAMSSSVCRHAYHEACLRRWLSGDSKTCPGCRIKIGAIQSC